MRSRRSPLTVLALAAVLLATGCAAEPGPDAVSFDEWSSTVIAEHGDGSGPGAGGHGPGSVQIEAVAAGAHEVAAACRGADEATLRLSSGGVELDAIDVRCGAIEPTIVTLPSRDLRIETDADADWYLMLRVVEG